MRFFERCLASVALAALGLVSITRVADAQEPASCLSTNPSAWPSPSRPYFMIAFDTSGSMTTNVATSNSCGYTNNRIGHGRCALKNTVQAFGGTVNFGLASFAWRNECTGAATPNDCPASGVCSAVYAPGTNNFCGPFLNEPTLGVNVHSGGHVVVPMLQDHYWVLPPDPTNVGTLVEMGDNSCGLNNGVDNGNNTYNGELGANSNTPLGGILFDMNRYFSGTYVDKWTSATLPTPIGTAALGERPCRSLNVILITDGDETCDAGVSPTPVAGGCRNGFASYLNNSGERLASYEADRLFTTGVTIGGQNFKVRTHVIAFAGADIVAADHIATCGGTGTAYSTANEAQLSQALANIISSAINPEVCDNTDNNCNGCTDEGYSHYCNVKPGGCCTWNTLAQKTACGATACQCCNWATQAQRTTCLTQYQASITAGNPTGDLTLLPCTTPAQQAQPATWLCYDPKELCDNVDNNCSSGIDENQTKCGNPLHCPLPETCNGQDDNCDGITDNATGSPVPFSACPGNCQPSSEICDGCDNDCDGVADDGIPAVACGSTPPANCAGTQSCLSTGQSVPIGGCVGPSVPKGFGPCNDNPLTEICDGLDNDCDGTIDDGIAAVPCTIPGQPGLVYNDTFPLSQCKKGTLPCNGTCTGFIGPSAEVCDGFDNDCDGVVDDGVPGVGNVCGTDTGACSKGTTACIGGALVCQGGTQPQPESCNGIDDDCDGTTDDAPLTDQPTTSGCWGLPPTGCNPICTHQNLSWCPPPGGTCTTTGSLSAPCVTGSLQCDGVNNWKCVGGKAPTAEICDGTDNDCDTQSDENLGPPVGTQCGTDVGECEFGANVCDNGTIDCQGGKGPVAEVCNGLDDDCDSNIDNGIPIGGSCFPPYDTTLYPGPRDKGECKPGVNQCDPAGSGTLICVGGVGPNPEICDGKDNDCDGFVDEPGPPPDGIDGTANPLDPSQHIGDVCGVSTGQCKQGTLSCDAGKFVCVASIGPSPEICDCVDNDCDGKIDDNPEADSGQQNICSTGKTCVEAAAGVCQCALPCQGELCPGGTACKDVIKSGTTATGDFCVNDPCGDCSKKTVTNQQTGDVECAPTGNVPVCVCKGNLGCKSPCEGVVCDPGLACAPSGPSAGSCQPENNCYFFGCATGEACNGGVCVDDPCEPNPCAANEVCKPNATFSEPRCVASCAGVSCPSGNECVEGDCTPTGCGNDCPPGEVCSPEADGGTCGPSKCSTDGGLACANGAYCDPETGACGNPPCTAVKCPNAQECINGECQWAPEGGTGGAGGTSGGGGTGGGSSDASTGGGTGGGSSGTGNATSAPEKGVFGLATGGGGCSCKTAGGKEPLNRALALMALVGAVGVVLRRRAKSSREKGRIGMKREAWAAAFVMSMALGVTQTGCATESFCFSDCEGEGTSGSGGNTDAGGGTGGQINTDGSSATGGGINLDSSTPETCVPNPPELCNGIDDDCNGTVDDGFDFTSLQTCGDCDTHCDGLLGPPNSINQVCNPPASPPGPGTCTYDCVQDFYDLVDSIPGCEYQCTFNPNGTNTTDSGPPSGICGADDDCDGKIDEDLETCADIENCGKCGHKCSLANASAKCVTTAPAGTQCVWDPASPSNTNTNCEIDQCNPGYYDNDGNGQNGCEYQCPVATPSAELCDGVDNDCDGLIDNADADLETADPDVGDNCFGGTQGECAKPAHQGLQKCIGGVISCCDQDSNNITQTNPNFPPTGIRNGICDSPTGPQVIKPNDVSDTCNSLDDDCDGQVDDSPTDAGGACGSSSVGNCQKGTNQCQNGSLVCVGNIEPGTESCNGQDDNCDGVIDGIVPAGAPTVCTTNAQCSANQVCLTVGSGKQCVNKSADVIGDCAPPGLQLPVPPPCLKGTLTCAGGVIDCVGDVGPTAPTDACGVDTNCDGSLTNQPNLQNDVENCGSCGNDCNQIEPAGHGVWACQSGACVRTGCDTGFINCDANANNCEKACTFISSAEQCNGIDDNCNCQTDENIAAVPTPVQVCGVSPAATDVGCVTGPGGVTVSCTGGSWSCAFPTGYCTGTKPNYCSATVDSCDNKDNNCNGNTDENFKPPVLNQGYLGQPCASDDGLPPPGHGVCKGTGVYICSSLTATACNAMKDNSKVTAEACDNADNDCDGSVDEIYTAKGTNATHWVKPNVTLVTSTPANVYMFQYEATRPGATTTNPGSGNGYHTSAPAGTPLDKTKACSVPTAVPWFNVTGTEVEQTCTAMGGRACTTAEWQNACRPNLACNWGYNPRGAAGSACATVATATKFCNLGAFDFDPGVAGNQDGLLPTSSAALQNCWADWSALNGNLAANNNIRDMTGNLREIVKNATNQYKLMGGAFNSDSEDGSGCGFTFYTVDQTFKLFDTGFRCCFDANPS